VVREAWRDPTSADRLRPQPGGADDEKRYFFSNRTCTDRLFSVGCGDFYSYSFSYTKGNEKLPRSAKARGAPRLRSGQARFRAFTKAPRLHRGRDARIAPHFSRLRKRQILRTLFSWDAAWVPVAKNRDLRSRAFVGSDVLFRLRRTGICDPGGVPPGLASCPFSDEGDVFTLPEFRARVYRVEVQKRYSPRTSCRLG
jgi:hypothetical protein